MFENVRMHRGEDPQMYLSRVDDIVDMLESLGEHQNEDEVNRKKCAISPAIMTLCNAPFPFGKTYPAPRLIKSFGSDTTKDRAAL